MQPKAWGGLLGAGLALVACALIAHALWVTPASVSDGGVDVRARDIASVLKCPVCQNISVADSPSELAGQMRDLIHKKLEEGETRDQIIGYFADRYGQEVLLDPPKTGFNRLLWWGPVGALLGGLAVIGITLRQWLRGSSAQREANAPLTAGEEDAYLALASDLDVRASAERAAAGAPATADAAATTRVQGTPA